MYKGTVKRNLTLTIIAAGLVLAGCSRTFLIFPSGSLDTGIYFQFGFSESELTRNRITSFNVYAVSDTRSLDLIWSLSGRSRLGKIEYGVVPDRLNEQAPATNLERGGVYHVSATDDPIDPTSPPGGADLIFYLSEIGEPVTCDTAPECLSAVADIGTDQTTSLAR